MTISWWEKKSKEDEQNLEEWNSARCRSQAKCELVQTSYILNELNCSCFCHIINILLTKLSRSVWQGSTLRPVGSRMRLDLVRWRLTFLMWSPIWPPWFQVITVFYIYLLFHFLGSMTKWISVDCKPQGMHRQCIQLLISFLCKAVYTDLTVITIVKSVMYTFGWRYSGSKMRFLQKEIFFYHLFKK